MANRPAELDLLAHAQADTPTRFVLAEVDSWIPQEDGDDDRLAVPGLGHSIDAGFRLPYAISGRDPQRQAVRSVDGVQPPIHRANFFRFGVCRRAALNRAR